MRTKKLSIVALALCACANIYAENKVVSKDTDTTAILLEEVTISAGVSDVKNSPLRLKTVESEKIKQISVARTFPEILSATAGVYATRETGSYGDAKINIRGFKQENISILLNGIPISGLTSGNMYWNNWMGLADATSSVQLQKGIGSSMISDNSVGGTINIITDSPTPIPSVSGGYYFADYGTHKGYLSINSGDLGKGWAFTLSGSYVGGKGYVECTDVSSWSYLLSVSKKIDSHNSLLFTAVGSPEQHSQRSTRITMEEMEKYGPSYNKNWGWYNSHQKTLSRNNYFKPYFTLNHFYHNGKVRINTALYTAIASGGGYYSESTGKKIISFIGEDGHIDWNAVESYNKSSAEGNSQNILSDYMAGHTQFGAKSSLIYDFTDRISIDAGIHYQLYNTWEKEQITDLLGGNYWLEKGERKYVGDYIRTRNGRNTNYLTLYGMGSFTLGEKKNWIIKTGVSASGVTIRRWDTFNYTPENKWSDLATGIGGSFKGGILYKADKSNSIYLNAGVYSRAPYANVYFASGNNSISRNVSNENNYMGELGYRFIGDNFGAEATVYASWWQNKTLQSNPYKSADSEPYRFMVTGLDAFHYGTEIEAFWRYGKIIRIDAFASIGDWRWKNDVHADILDPYTSEIVQTINIYSNNLHVGDAPQTQVGASFEFNPLELFKGICAPLGGSDLSIGMRWSYNDRFYADFDPISISSVEKAADSYMIPSYHLVDLTASWTQRVGRGSSISIFMNVNNLLDALYIERGKDGATHDASSFSGFWGSPRTFNFGIRFNVGEFRK